MPNGLNNWAYRDVTRFLKESGFMLYEQKSGSHEAWINNDKQSPAVVEINFTHRSYPVRTLETMIRQSKIERKAWRKWASQGRI
jgi:predicted RNA binding protein YcfA (HicA-like mRNA interferase family)